jgi:hypothetical protein
MHPPPAAATPHHTWSLPIPANKQIKVVNADNGISMGGVDFLTIDDTRFEFSKPR